jgi:hypothetical protein
MAVDPSIRSPNWAAAEAIWQSKLGAHDSSCRTSGTVRADVSIDATDAAARTRGCSSGHVLSKGQMRGAGLAG